MCMGECVCVFVYKICNFVFLYGKSVVLKFLWLLLAAAAIHC